LRAYRENQYRDDSSHRTSLCATSITASLRKHKRLLGGVLRSDTFAE
jgi:hypothetical protein